MVKCNSCGATYATTMPDGSAYYHACAPLSPAELQTKIAAGQSPLSPTQQRIYDDARALDSRAPRTDGGPSYADLALSRVIVERPDKRDENIVGRGRADEPPRIKADGKGVTVLPPAPAP